MRCAAASACLLCNFLSRARARQALHLEEQEASQRQASAQLAGASEELKVVRQEVAKQLCRRRSEGGDGEGRQATTATTATTNNNTAAAVADEGVGLQSKPQWGGRRTLLHLDQYVSGPDVVASLVASVAAARARLAPYPIPPSPSHAFLSCLPSHPACLPLSLL